VLLSTLRRAVQPAWLTWTPGKPATTDYYLRREAGLGLVPIKDSARAATLWFPFALAATLSYEITERPEMRSFKKQDAGRPLGPVYASLTGHITVQVTVRGASACQPLRSGSRVGRRKRLPHLAPAHFPLP
jgi:hypothetical protein